MMTRTLLVLTLLPGLVAAKPEGRSGDLKEELDRLVAASGLKNAKIGIHLWSDKANSTVYSKDDDQPFTLASNTKLLTCAAALDRLGPDFKFESVLYAGEIREGSTYLAVKGNGDPNLSGRFFHDDPTSIFKRWAESLKKKGIKKITGILLLNDGFDTETTCPGWKSYDPWFWWAAPFGTFSLNDNCVDVKIEPGREGDPAKITIIPDTKCVTIVNKTSTVKKSPKAWGFTRKAGTNEITFTGEFAAGARPATTWVTIHDPFAFYGTVLQETLRGAGLEVEGEAKVSDASQKDVKTLTEIDRHETDLATTLKVCLGVSQNFYAEMILRTLAWKVKGRGSREKGLEVVKEFLKEIGIENCVQSDGSGLTRENRLMPSDIVKLLRHMKGHKHAKIWFASLPVNGGDPGTLKRRMTAKDVAGKVHAKTGHIDKVAALSGYLETGTGDTYVFSILVNDWTGGDPNRFQDRFCEFLIRYQGD